MKKMIFEKTNFCLNIHNLVCTKKKKTELNSYGESFCRHTASKKDVRYQNGQHLKVIFSGTFQKNSK